MATPTHITKLSRRAMLAGSGAVAALSVPPIMTSCPNDDDELLYWIAVAERRWAEFVAARELRERLYQETRRHPDCPITTKLSVEDRAKFNEIAERTGYRDAADRCGDLHDLYGETIQTAFGIPGHTLRGVQAKMKLAADVARIGDAGAYTKTEFEWLDIAMADFERLSGIGGY